MAGDVTQCDGPEFNLQNTKNKHNQAKTLDVQW